MKGKNKRLEVRVEDSFLEKLQTIIKGAAEIKSKAAAIEFAVDIAIKTLKEVEATNFSVVSHHRKI